MLLIRQYGRANKNGKKQLPRISSLHVTVHQIFAVLFTIGTYDCKMCIDEDYSIRTRLFHRLLSRCRHLSRSVVCCQTCCYSVVINYPDICVSGPSLTFISLEDRRRRVPVIRVQSITVHHCNINQVNPQIRPPLIKEPSLRTRIPM